MSAFVNSPYLTAEEAATYLRYRSSSGIRTAVMRGELKPVGRGPRGMLLFRREDLDDFVRGRASSEMGRLARSAERQADEADTHPGIFMLSEQTYRIRLRVIDPKTGKLKEVDRTRDCTIKEAVALQAAWRREVETSGRGRRERVRLSTYARSWLESRAVRLKPSTARRYAEILDLHILPRFGDCYLDALSPSQIGAWLAEQVKEYAGWTVTNYLRVFRTLTRDAMADYDLPRDPCLRLKPPRVRVFTDDLISVTPE